MISAQLIIPPMGAAILRTEQGNFTERSKL